MPPCVSVAPFGGSLSRGRVYPGLASRRPGLRSVASSGGSIREMTRLSRHSCRAYVGLGSRRWVRAAQCSVGLRVALGYVLSPPPEAEQAGPHAAGRHPCHAGVTSSTSAAMWSVVACYRAVLRRLAPEMSSPATALPRQRRGRQQRRRISYNPATHFPGKGCLIRTVSRKVRFRATRRRYVSEMGRQMWLTEVGFRGILTMEDRVSERISGRSVQIAASRG